MLRLCGNEKTASTHDHKGERMSTYLLIGVLLGIGILGFFIYRKVSGTLAEFSQTAFGTKHLLEGFRRQAEQLETTPKSVAGMTRVFLPQIEKDFPEFSWAEFKHRTENMLTAFLSAVDTGETSVLEHPSEELLQQLNLRLEDGRRREIREHYQNIKIHQTEISGYRKNGVTCVITMQSAVEYEHWEEDTKEEVIGEVRSGAKDRKEQTKYNTELVYIQDVDKIQNQTTGVGITCPNCGAPVTRLGSKFCEYCGSAIREVSMRVWSLNKIYES